MSFDRKFPFSAAGTFQSTDQMPLTVALEVRMCKCPLPGVSKQKHWNESNKLHSKILVMCYMQLMSYFSNLSKYSASYNFLIVMVTFPTIHVS